jgi:hypothetical protein
MTDGPPADAGSDETQKLELDRIEALFRRVASHPRTREMIGDLLRRVAGPDLEKILKDQEVSDLIAQLEQLPPLVQIKCEGDCLHSQNGFCSLPEIRMAQQETWPLDAVCRSRLRRSR